MFDITVEGEHTYTINDCIVHNSAGGSLIAFCLDITKLDPIKYDLLFERFMSESRCPDLCYDYFTKD